MGVALKQKLLAELERLSEEHLAEVLDFVNFLLFKENKITSKAETLPTPERDPLLNFIGGVSHGNLAKDIDKEVYGE